MLETKIFVSVVVEDAFFPSDADFSSSRLELSSGTRLIQNLSGFCHESLISVKSTLTRECKTLNALKSYHYLPSSGRPRSVIDPRVNLRTRFVSISRFDV